MKTRFVLPILGAVAALHAQSEPALAQACVWPAQNHQQTGDSHYAAALACDHDIRAFFWDAYSMEPEDWDNGWGYQVGCDSRYPLQRTYHGLYALHYSSPNPITSGSNYGNDPLRWGGQYSRNNIDELNGGCTNGIAAAKTWFLSVDDMTDLYWSFFFDFTPPERAGAIVHEATHADFIDHDSSNACPRGTSCDRRYGSENANTHEVWFLAAYSQRAIRANWVMKDRARDRANSILDRAFIEPTNVRVPNYPDVPLVSDVNMDGRDDLVIFRQAAGTWHVLDGRKLVSSGTRSELVSGRGYGGPTDQPLMGDVDLDGFPDLVIYRTRSQSDLDQKTAGYWFAFSLAKGRVLFENVQIGSNGAVPLLGDLNGDRAADLIVFEPTSGLWLAYSGTSVSSGAPQQIISRTFGGAGGDVPLIGNMNSDLPEELVIYRPSDGTWHAWSNVSNAYVFTGIQFGENGDIPFVADFDGDGRKDDLGLYRPRLGEWHARSVETLLFGPVVYGSLYDRPLVGRFGANSPAVSPIIYRPYEGTWHSFDRITGAVNFGGVAYGAPY